MPQQLLGCRRRRRRCRSCMQIYFQMRRTSRANWQQRVRERVRGGEESKIDRYKGRVREKAREREGEEGDSLFAHMATFTLC